jgi:hypothetical protein
MNWMCKDREKNNFAVSFANHPTERDGYYELPKFFSRDPKR